MRNTNVILPGKTEKEALLEGAKQLGLEPDEVAVQEVGDATFLVSIKDAPGRFEIIVREDKMAALIKFITPPFGTGAPVTTQDIERSLANLKIVFGINKKAIADLIASVASTGKTQKNLLVAAGEPPLAGKDATIDLEVGQEALNKNPQACNIVRAGQIIAVKEPATKAKPGRNIFGKEIPAPVLSDAKFSVGDHVAMTEGGRTLVATTYGMAQVTSKGISVSSLVQVSPDKMWAEIPIFPTLADNSKLTLEDVLIALEKAGVVHGVRKDVIKEALLTGEQVQQLRVAEGTPPKNGVDAQIDFEFRLSGGDPETVDAKRKADHELQSTGIVKELVLAGEVLARKTPARRPEDGVAVTGSVLKGAEPKDKKVTAGTNVTLLSDGLTYVVSKGVVGYADYVGGALCVEDPILISPDRMHVYLSVHPPSGQAKRLTMELAEELLANHGIRHGIERKAIERALTSAVSGGKPVLDHPIAEGTPPLRGQDGKIEFKFLPEKIPGTVIDPAGRMDYRERQTIQNVKPGDVLAVKIPPTAGKDGLDVLGNTIPNEPGMEKALTPIGNVSVSGDGLTFSAEIDGIVTLAQEDKIGVFKEYQLPGDVDFSTGNLTLNGSLDIKGWIRSGFTVRAKGEIRVAGGIEDATVEAGANLTVDGGVIGSQQGRIISGGDIRARFFENATLQAQGDIFAREYILGCSAKANGRIILTEGKGCVRGGSIEAVKGIEVKEIGAEAGHKTLVAVGKDTAEIRKRMADAAKTLGDMQQKRAKIEVVLSRYASKMKTKPLPKEVLQKLARLSKFRHRMALYETRLIEQGKELAQEVARIDAEVVTVKVEKAVYSGTTVLVRGFGYYVNEDVRGKVEFVFRPEQQLVELLGKHK